MPKSRLRWRSRLQSKPRPFDRHTRLIVSGAVEKGGVTIGLLKRNQWAVQVNVAEPGPFTAVIAAPADGAPGLDRKFLVGCALDELCVGKQDRLHRSLLPDRGLCGSKGTIAAAQPILQDSRSNK